MAVDSVTTRNDGWAGVLPALSDAATVGGDGGARFTSRRGLGADELETLFRQNWLARELVQRFAADATRRWGRVCADDPAVAEALKNAIEALGGNTRNAARRVFRDAIQWALLYGGALAILGLDDGEADFSKPLNESNLRRLRWVIVADATRCQPYAWDTDPTSATFGEPAIYSVGGAAGVDANLLHVHASRVLRFDGVSTPPEVLRGRNGWCDSILESCHDPIRNYDATLQGAAKAAEQFVLQLLEMDDLTDILSQPDGAERLKVRATALRSTIAIGKVALVDRQHERFERLGQPVTGLPELIDRMGRAVAGAVNIPEALLFGQQQGVRAGADADMATYLADVESLRGEAVAPQMARLLRLLQLCREGPTGGVIDPSVKFELAPLQDADRKASTEAAKTLAQALKVLIDANVIDPVEARTALAEVPGLELDAEVTEAMAMREPAEATGADEPVDG